MLHIVTGEMNCGKTAKIREIHKMYGGDGFVSDKIFSEDQHIGYELSALGSNEKWVLAKKTDLIDEAWTNSLIQGEFQLNKEVFSHAITRIEEMMIERIKPIFLDEIGYLEVRKQEGFYKIIEQLTSYPYDVYLVIRISCLQDAIRIFNLKNYRILNLNYKNNRRYYDQSDN
ncbi:MAG: nucleoside-triphosphatase [Candidatus Cloacimonetes bacterium]|nr:nucleoside-triphosphatase [Candidatus Cloacimonadota bacterium]